MNVIFIFIVIWSHQFVYVSENVFINLLQCLRQSPPIQNFVPLIRNFKFYNNQTCMHCDNSFSSIIEELNREKMDLLNALNCQN